ncbi:MAG: PQQ-binding-like beta-propeller repeat protein, partial [Planctomycetaceae bacterium]
MRCFRVANGTRVGFNDTRRGRQRLGGSLALPMAAAVASVFAMSAASAEDWPQFRGPNATGVSTQSKNLPVEFSHETKVRWKADLGEGIGCPVVAGGRVFATAMVGPQKFAVFCFDAAGGKELWRKEFETGPLPGIMPPNTQASSTPASDGERVYVYFSTLGMMAFAAADGELVWKQAVQMPFYLMGWGAAHSPIVHGDMVIFNQDDDLAPFLLALDKYTGNERWRTERPEMLAGYAIPVVCTAGGRTDVVVAGSGKLKGYDPADGKELWTCNTLLRTMMTSPAVVDDRIYVSVESYGDTDRVLKYALLEWKDTNQDGKLAKSELAAAFAEKFDKGDANKDGYLVGDEIDDAFQSATNRVGGGNIVQCIRGGGTGDVTATHVQWNIKNTAPSNIVSPLVTGGRLFLVKKGGISASFNSADGKTVWEKKRIRNLGNYYASPIAGDRKIYVTGENGFIVVLEDSPELKVLAKNDMGEPCLATPAIADGRLFVRTLNKL